MKKRIVKVGSKYYYQEKRWFLGWCTIARDGFAWLSPKYKYKYGDWDTYDEAEEHARIITPHFSIEREWR